jgi:signal transduction histidine kinase/CheY-like chemotaxis protein
VKILHPIVSYISFRKLERNFSRRGGAIDGRGGARSRLSLQDIHQALGVLGDHLPDGAAVLTLRPASAAFEPTHFVGDVASISGIDREKLARYPGLWLHAIHPDDKGHVAKALAELSSHSSLSLEYRISTTGGDERFIREDLRCLPDEPRIALGVIRDITAECTLRERAESLEEQLFRAQRMATLGTLATGIAHDFNNLLTTVIATIQILEHELDLDTQGEQDLFTIRSAATRGGTLVRQILEFAGREEAAGTEPIDLGIITRALEPLLARSLGEDVHLVLDVGEGLWPIGADIALVEQIVLNLVVNAREAMTRGGELTIRTTNVRLLEPLDVEGDVLRPGCYGVLSVRDTGAGVAERIRRRIFERNVSTKEDRGAGVGLATVRRIVRDWHGGIEVESRPGEGAIFRIYLPARDADAISLPPEAGLERGTEPEAIRVLVVEHRPALRTLIERALTREGYSVVAVGTAREGLEVFDRVKPRFNLVVLDSVLPHRSGEELYRALSRRVDELPAVFVADQSSAEEGGGGSAPGIRLTDPFSAGSLLDAVDLALAAGIEDGTNGPAAEAGA